MPAKKAGVKKGAGKEDIDPELSGSNVLSVGEGVLLKWLSYHLEQANRVSVTLPRITLVFYNFNSEYFSSTVPAEHVCTNLPHLCVDTVDLG